MIQSMTGFGRASVVSSRKKITVELKSLNSKQFDISIRIPSYLKEYEILQRNFVAAAVERGKVDMSVSIENIIPEATANVNIQLLSLYKIQLEKLKSTLGLPEPTDWYSLLMRMPDSMKSDVVFPGEDEKNALMEATKLATDNLREFRIQEGRKLYNFFIDKIEEISLLLDSIEPFEKERVGKIRKRLEDQLGKLTSIEYDASRLEQEMIYYIEKLDVSEEKLRLRSHLNYFLETLGDDNLPDVGQGKKLGFIAQEMGREINTLGSKSNDAEMQKIVVKMKDNLEQIKEQVLNVL